MPIALGLVAFGFHLSQTLDGRWPPGFGILAVGAAAALALALVGVLTRTTVGIIAFWLLLAAVVGSVIYFVRGETGNGFAMAGQAVLFYAVQFFLVGLRVRAGELPGPQRRDEFQMPEYELSARCFFAGISESIQVEQGGLGVLYLLPGDELLFITRAGTRTWMRADQLESWRDSTGDPVLAHAHGLDPAAETLTLTGSVVVMKPDLYLQGENIESWRRWLAQVPVPQR